MIVENYKDIYNKLSYKKEELQNKKNYLDNMVKDLEKRINLIMKAQIFMQEVAQKTQSNIVLHIENIIDKALEAVFQDEYKFKFNFEQKRGKTEVEYFLERKDGNIVDVINGVGGGIIDIVSFALRIAVWTLLNNCENIIILDEPFRFLSLELQERAGEILNELSKSLRIQFIIVTHNDKLIEFADEVFKISKNNDFSKIEKVEVK